MDTDKWGLRGLDISDNCPSEKTVLVGGRSGILLSTDEGVSWKSVLERPHFSRDVLCFTTTQDGTVYAGGFIGVFRSTDTGQSWLDASGDLDNSNIHGMVITPAGEIFLAMYMAGVYKSTNGGLTWTTKNSGLTSLDATDIIRCSTGDLFLMTYSGIFRSSDNGESWMASNTGSEYPGGVKLFSRRRATSTTDDIFACMLGGLYRSTDYGSSWVFIDVPITMNANIVEDPRDQSLIGVAETPFRSTDNGDHWVSGGVILPADPAGSPIWWEALAVNSSGYLYAGSYGKGVSRSTDGGHSWSACNVGLAGFYSLSLTITPNGHVFAGADSYGGVFRTTDNGATWEQRCTGWDNYVNVVAAEGDGNLLAGTNSNLFRSTDEGRSWLNLTNSFIDIWDIALGPGGDMYVAAQRQGISRSTDNGATWVPMNAGLPHLFEAKIMVNTNGDLYTLTYDGFLYRSSDKGESWVSRTIPVQGERLNCLARNSQGAVFVGTSNAIIRTTDHGETWTTIDLGLKPGHDVLTLAVPAGSILIAGTWDGMFRSTDAGVSWQNVSSGLPNIPSYHLVLNEDGIAYVDIPSYGIFRSAQAITDVSLSRSRMAMPTESGVCQNYPNPFNPTTTIEYSVGVDSRQGLVAAKVRLAVYDMLGREVAVVVDEKKMPGSYEVRFDGSGLASGVYFYRLEAGSFVQTRRFLLLR